MIRAVVDTNLIVSQSISATGAAAEILRRWRQQQFELVVSTPVLDEYRRALGYECVRARHGMTTLEINGLVAQFARFAIHVEPTNIVDVIMEDADDNKFLACAETGEAEIVVSRDEHLLKLRVYKSIRILSPAAFLAFLDASEP